VLSAIWGVIVSWAWQTFGPMVAALAATVSALATVVYTIGTFLLWLSTRRSVRAMEHAVQLTFMQMTYEATGRSAPGGAMFGDQERTQAMLDAKHRRDFLAALQRDFPGWYASLISKEKPTEPGERQEIP
jgi:hypothetical protein